MVPMVPLALLSRQRQIPVFQSPSPTVPARGNIFIELETHVADHHLAGVIERIDSLQQKLDTIRRGIAVEALDACERLDNLDALRHEQRERLELRRILADRRCGAPGKDEPSRRRQMNYRMMSCQHWKSRDANLADSAPLRAVYRPGEATVNQHTQSRSSHSQYLGAAAAMWCVMVATGCSTLKSLSIEPTYLMALRYDVEPEFVRQGPSATRDSMRSDFKRAAGLGFDAVVLRHLDAGDQPAVLNLAVSHRLTPVIPSRAVQHHIRTGAWPAGTPNATALVDRYLAHSSSAARAYPRLLDGSHDEASDARAKKLLAAARQLGVRCLAIGDSGMAGGPDSLAVVTTTGDATQVDGSPMEQWLAQYHRELLLGKTGGIVVDRYRRLPGDPPGLASDGRPMPTAQAAALRALVTRVRRWAPHIQRTTVQPVDAVVSANADIRVVCLERGKRRHLLIFNPSGDQYARGDVSLPESIGGSALIRAVEVPSSETAPAGLVLFPVRGRIVVNVVLRPGDAVLFELF